MQNLSKGRAKAGSASPLPNHGISSGSNVSSPSSQHVATQMYSQPPTNLSAALSPSQLQVAETIYAALQQIQTAQSILPTKNLLIHNPQQVIYPATMTNLGTVGSSYYIPSSSPAATAIHAQHPQLLNNPMALATLLNQYQQTMMVNGTTSDAYGISSTTNVIGNNNVMSNPMAHPHHPVPSTYSAAQALASLLQQSQGTSKPIVQPQHPPVQSYSMPSSHASLSNQTSSLSSSEAIQTETTDSEQVSASSSHDIPSSTNKVKNTVPKRKLPKNSNVASRSGTTTSTTSSSSSTHHSLPFHPLPINATGYPPISNKTIPPLVMSQMQKQSLAELEQHVKLLMDMNHPVPNQVLMLLQEQRLVEEKKMAKRLINRKSASSSRARKKKLVEEMMLNNAKLRRQATILSLIPDLVIAIKPDGEITFCSGQVERILYHKVLDLIGANISSIITPASREALHKLIDTLLASEKVAPEDGNNESGRSSNSGNTSGAPMVSEQSDQCFPLSIVKVNSFKEATDSSGDKKQSELVAPSPTSQVKDDSEVSDPSNLSTANEALDRNVRNHNELLKKQKEAKKKASAHKDDVTGDTVTANNASARLSSLLQPPAPDVKKLSSDDNLEDNESSSSSDSLLGGVEDKRHKKRKSPENTSDDSGYREDSGSSTSETSNSGRRRTLVPTCNICLVRDDLSTIWCEVTSSLRAMPSDEESCQDAQTTSSQEDKALKADSSQNSEDQKMRSSPKLALELLLCLRPLRDGSEKVSEELRFLPKKSLANPDRNHLPSSDSGTKHSITEAASSSSKSTFSLAPENEKLKPMKKRRPPPTPSEDVHDDTQNAIESLIQMSNTKL